MSNQEIAAQEGERRRSSLRNGFTGMTVEQRQTRDLVEAFPTNRHHVGEPSQGLFTAAAPDNTETPEDVADEEVNTTMFQKIGKVIKSMGLVAFFIFLVAMESPGNKARSQVRLIGQLDAKVSEAWIIFIMTITMWIVSLTLSIALYGFESLKIIFSARQLLDFLPFSICFALCNSPKAISIAFMSSDLQKVFTSMKTVFAALVFGFTRVHRYSLIQKLMLVLITGSVVAYCFMDALVKKDDKSHDSKWDSKHLAKMQENFAKSAPDTEDAAVPGSFQKSQWYVDPKIEHCVKKGKMIPRAIWGRVLPELEHYKFNADDFVEVDGGLAIKTLPKQGRLDFQFQMDDFANRKVWAVKSADMDKKEVKEVSTVDQIKDWCNDKVQVKKSDNDKFTGDVTNGDAQEMKDVTRDCSDITLLFKPLDNLPEDHGPIDYWSGCEHQWDAKYLHNALLADGTPILPTANIPNLDNFADYFVKSFDKNEYVVKDDAKKPFKSDDSGGVIMIRKTKDVLLWGAKVEYFEAEGVAAAVCQEIIIKNDDDAKELKAEDRITQWKKAGADEWEKAVLDSDCSDATCTVKVARTIHAAKWRKEQVTVPMDSDYYAKTTGVAPTKFYQYHTKTTKICQKTQVSVIAGDGSGKHGKVKTINKKDVENSDYKEVVSYEIEPKVEDGEKSEGNITADAKNVTPFATLIIQSPKKNDDKPVIIGILLIAIHLALHAWGSWFGEKALKKGKKVPYVMQKATEMTIATVVNVIQVFCIWPFMPATGDFSAIRDDLIYNGNIWNGWNYFGTLFAFGILWCRHYIAGLVVKNLDTIVKQVSSNAAIGIVYFVSIWWAITQVTQRVITLDSNYPKNKLGYDYSETVYLIKGDTSVSYYKCTALAVVTACCLGWAIVSRYTKVKAAWKKLYLELKKKEEELNEPTNMTELVAEYAEAPVTGTTAEQQRLLNGGQLPH